MQNTPKRIQSVQRAIDIISCFHHTDIELSLGEISTALSLNKSTVHGIISTLYANNYVTQVPSGKYKLGSIFTAAKYEGKATRRIILKEKASPFMHRLADRFFGSAALFYRDGTNLIVLNRITPSAANYVITVHESIINPLHTSASGKILLATFSERELLSYLERNPMAQATEHTIHTIDDLKENLSQIRWRGYSTEDEELGRGIYAVSTPIYDEKDELFATLSITGLSVTLRGNQELIDELLAASKNLSYSF